MPSMRLWFIKFQKWELLISEIYKISVISFSVNFHRFSCLYVCLGSKFQLVFCWICLLFAGLAQKKIGSHVCLQKQLLRFAFSFFFNYKNSISRSHTTRNWVPYTAPEILFMESLRNLNYKNFNKKITWIYQVID